MRELKNYLYENNLNETYNPFYKNVFFNLFSQEVYECGPDERTILGVVQIFEDDNHSYRIEFDKKFAVIAYLICCFECDFEINYKLNDKNLIISANLSNFLSFISEISDINVITFITDKDTYLMIKSSIIYNTDAYSSESRSLANALKTWGW